MIDGAVAGYREFLDFFRKEYLPQARARRSAPRSCRTAAPTTRSKIREFTTLDLTPEEIHKIGLAEVERISRGDERGDAAGRLQGRLRGLPQVPAHRSAVLRQDAARSCSTRASCIAKQIDGKLPSLFRRCRACRTPSSRCRRTSRPSTPRGRYVGAPQGSTQPGIYWVNTYMLESRPLYNLEALTLHEAVPGHHLQIALEPRARRPAELPPLLLHLGLRRGVGALLASGWAWRRGSTTIRTATSAA